MAEGGKCVAELSPFFSCKWLVATDAWLMEHGRELPAGMPVWKARADELERMSQVRTPQGVLAVFAIPDQEAVAPVGDELYIALDRVQDPGNLGTIIRLADWFGISRIYASSDTVDVFNSKVVQSTMGGWPVLPCSIATCPGCLRRLWMPASMYMAHFSAARIYIGAADPWRHNSDGQRGAGDFSGGGGIVRPQAHYPSVSDRSIHC